MRYFLPEGLDKVADGAAASALLTCGCGAYTAVYVNADLTLCGLTALDGALEILGHI